MIALQKLKKTLISDANKKGKIIAIRSNGLQVSTTDGKTQLFPYQTGFKLGDEVLISATGLIKLSKVQATREYEV